MTITPVHRAPSPRHVTLFALVIAVGIAAAVVLPGAQAPARKALTIDDYTKWRSIERPAISGDGKWVAYTLQTTNVVAAEAKPVLHLLNLETEPGRDGGGRHRGHVLARLEVARLPGVPGGRAAGPRRPRRGGRRRRDRGRRQPAGGGDDQRVGSGGAGRKGRQRLR